MMWDFCLVKVANLAPFVLLNVSTSPAIARWSATGEIALVEQKSAPPFSMKPACSDAFASGSFLKQLRYQTPVTGHIAQTKSVHTTNHSSEHMSGMLVPVPACLEAHVCLFP